MSEFLDLLKIEGEDGVEMSAAGQMETVLGVTGLEKVTNGSAISFILMQTQ